MTRIYALVFLLPFTSQLHAQQNVVATGNNGSGTGGSVSYTIGQIDYQSNSGSTGNVNQGVQQPYELFQLTSLNELDLLVTTVFPNPTNGMVQLSVSSLENNLECTLFDLTGRIIHSTQIVATQTELDLSQLASGEYLLKISNDAQKYKTVKIVKH